MKELLDKLITEAGLNKEQAEKTIKTTLEFVKSKIPPAFASNIETMLGLSADDTTRSTVADAAGNTTQAAQDTMKDKYEDFKEDAKEKMNDFSQKAEEIAGEVKEKLSEAADLAEDIAKDAMSKIKDWMKK